VSKATRHPRRALWTRLAGVAGTFGSPQPAQSQAAGSHASNNLYGLGRTLLVLAMLYCELMSVVLTRLLYRLDGELPEPGPALRRGHLALVRRGGGESDE
jgi:hypothetical protein